jgi:peptide/nickel transport system permease protein
MLGGAIIIETVFALPGVGSLLIQAVLSRDYAVVQAVVFVFAALVLIANLITDVSYSLLDPRVKLE